MNPLREDRASDQLLMLRSNRLEAAGFHNGFATAIGPEGRVFDLAAAGSSRLDTDAATSNAFLRRFMDSFGENRTIATVTQVHAATVAVAPATPGGLGCEKGGILLIDLKCRKVLFLQMLSLAGFSAQKPSNIAQKSLTYLVVDRVEHASREAALTGLDRADEAAAGLPRCSSGALECRDAAAGAGRLASHRPGPAGRCHQRGRAALCTSARGAWSWRP